MAMQLPIIEHVVTDLVDHFSELDDCPDAMFGDFARVEVDGKHGKEMGAI